MPSEPDSNNYFKIFDLDENYLIDNQKLEDKYQELLNRYHPDKFANDNQVNQKRAVVLGANINAAYQVLKDPVARANYIIENWGYKKVLEDRYISPEIINQQIIWREKIINCENQKKLDEYLLTIEENIEIIEKKIAEDFTQLRSIDVSPKKIAEKIKHLQLWQKLYQQALDHEIAN